MPPIVKKSLSAKLSSVKPKPRGPLWEGPSGSGWNGGVTQSLIKAFLSCRERFRIKYVEGWRPQQKFHPRMDYGSMFHVCCEHFDGGKDWEGPLLFYCRDLVKKFPFQQTEINHWFEVCRTQFPLYTQWWAEHPEVVERIPLMQEYPFDVKYRLPSGRVVRLRGKFDGVDLIGTGAEVGIYLFETKTKGDIDEMEIQRNLSWDIQSMMYLTALTESQGLVDYEASGILSDELQAVFESTAIKGVRYNVVRRPLSGGKGSITQGKGTKGTKCSKCVGTGSFTDKKTQATTTCPKCFGACRLNALPPETDTEFFARLTEKIRNATGQEYEVRDDENYFFRRWKAEVSPASVERFRRECLDPILEQMCDWYECVTGCSSDDPFRRCEKHGSVHYRHPFGAENTVDLYGASDIDELINNGSTVGLTRSEELFSELKT